MNAREAIARLQGLKVPAVATSDAAAVLETSITAASQLLRRLAGAGLVTAVRKGLWALEPDPDPVALAGYITAPYPAYVSLQTALYRRGMIQQIPEDIFVVSLGRAGQVRTRIGNYHVHHIQPALFGGFETPPGSPTGLATPEKALVDFLYLSPTRTRLFTALPEMELPRGFRRAVAREWARQIPTPRLRTLVQSKLDAVFAKV